MHSPTVPEPDQAGQNLMLNSPELADALRVRIALLNYMAESSRLRRRLEDAEIRANGMRAWLMEIQRENDTLRMMLGLSYKDWGPLPSPYPDSEIAKLLGEFCKVDQSAAPPARPYFKGPLRAVPLAGLDSWSRVPGVPVI